MKTIITNILGAMSVCMKSFFLASLILLLSAFSAFAEDGTYRVYWGTNNSTSTQSPPTNGTGGTVTSIPTITRGVDKNYTGSQTITFDVSPSTSGNGYYVKEIRGRRNYYDHGTVWTSWYVLNNSSYMPMITVNGTQTTITLSTAKINNYYRDFEIAVVFAENSTSTSSGTFKIDWGTNGTGGSGGAITSPTYTISRGSTVTYNGAETIVFNIAPNFGYYVGSIRARRTDSDGDWNSWQTLNDNDVSMIVKNDASTNVTLNTAKYNGTYRNYEIEVTFASNTVFVSWGTNTDIDDGLGGTVTSTDRVVENNQNVTPGFTSYATANFTLNPATGNTVTKVEYKRSDWSNWSNVPGWSSGNSTFSFSIDSHNWFVRVTFRTPTVVTRKITSYYGTTNTADFNTNPANWEGGNVYRGSTQIGTEAHLSYTYDSDKTTRTVRITPSSGYKITQVKWYEATWSDPAVITTVGAVKDADSLGLLTEYNNTSNSITLPTTKDTQFIMPVASPKSYLVWVVFAPVGATGGTVGAWYGTNNTTDYDTPVANGSGGTVYKTTGTNQLLANRDSTGTTIATDSTVTFEARPASGFRVSSIMYGQDNPTVTGAINSTPTSNQTFSFSVNGGNNYKIWVVFTSTAASTFNVTGTDVTSDAPDVTDCPPATNSISPTPQVVNINDTATFTLSTLSSCSVASVNFCSGATCTGDIAWSGVGNTYTTPPITADSSIKVKFRKIGFNIVSERDSTSPSGCGEISPVGTINYTKGSNATYTITSTSACTVAHVWVKDTNAGLNTVTDIAPLSGSTYTFQDIQAAGSIKVQFTEVIPTSADSYCQLPPFVAGQTGLAPNVLIVFDNSGSMGGTSGDAYYNKKTYDCTSSSSTLSNCTTFYGYFDPGKMYKIASSAVSSSVSASNTYQINNVTLNLTATNGMSGNYLNYRNMDKVDVVRKALMGGKILDRTAATKYLKSNNGKLIEFGSTLPIGIVQKLSSKVRFGMMVFNDPPEGGHLATVGTTGRKTVLGASEADLIEAMESSQTDPKTNTPISETLYEAIRYYQHKKSAYNSGVDYATMDDPIQNNCQKHFILLLTDGEPNSNNNLPGLSTQPTLNGYTDTSFDVNVWENQIPTNDRAINNNSTCFSNTYHCPADSTNNCSTNSEKVEAVSFYMHNTDLRTDRDGKQNITLFPVYAFGNGTGTKTLHMAAKYGGYDNKNGNLPSPNTWASPDEQLEWDQDTDCTPDNYFEADSGDVLENSIMTAMSNILAKVSSGTAASILSNSEGSGANLLQAVFYPSKIFEKSTEANWIGEMQNFWYYVDPFVNNSTVREDTDFDTTTPTVRKLELKKDYVANFIFDGTQTKVALSSDTNGDGTGDVSVSTGVDPDDVKSLWRAGKQLWLRDSADRTIFTSTNGISLLSGGFDISNKTSLAPYLQAANNDGGAEAAYLISYIRGEDSTAYRNRTVTILTTPPSTFTTGTWKLGDIVASTPKLQSSVKLNNYDADSPAGYGDLSYKKFVATSNYASRGMVYVGANDGMFHAFKLGKLEVTGSLISGDLKATLTGSNIGREEWAYVPRNALPYLKYYTDRANYQHIYYVDGQTVLVDVSTGGCTESTEYSQCVKDTENGSNWRTVVIGSMGLGGASKIKGSGCTGDIAVGTCVKTPIYEPKVDGTFDNTKGVGYSSYFAFDVTNQYADGTAPLFKWEFSHPDMGYATSGAAIVKINASTTYTSGTTTTTKPDTTKNGKWFAVFASGPTGPIEVATHKFMAKSDQNLKFFVIDLGATIDAEHPFVLNTNYWVLDSNIPNAFGGTVVNAALDTDRWNKVDQGNYEDDVLYAGYTNKADSVSEWTNGGVVRILTKGSINPANWAISQVIKDVGPVTTSVSRLQNRKAGKEAVWLYFGTGRYYYGGDDTVNVRHLIGVKDGCYGADNRIDKNCITSDSGPGEVLTLDNLSNQSGVCDSVSKGWYIALREENAADSMSAERVISDPAALTSGTVYFTSFSPTSDVCSFGGTSYMWALKFDTGCLPLCSALSGKALMQMSTGSFQELTLSDIFSCARPDGTTKVATVTSLTPTLSDGTTPPPPKAPKAPDQPYVSPPSPPIIGKPPGPAPTILDPFGNVPLKKVIHIKEK
ncbi:MAG: hypothetical protein PHN84_09360 [Desulfuromonadaceae bacterium]|nr:hypothetical protein [Desulfuromonadaceae bacterium]MDD2854087.1 hypothetical protein [Desulfuromonadaceae bacterium]